MIRVESFGKINLFLEVGPLRDDGFHEISTIMQTISVSDTIEIEDSLDLTQTTDSTVNSIITSLTILVLRLAPCLDLLAERASVNGERTAPPSS